MKHPRQLILCLNLIEFWKAGANYNLIKMSETRKGLIVVVVSGFKQKLQPGVRWCQIQNFSAFFSSLSNSLKHLRSDEIECLTITTKSEYHTRKRYDKERCAMH